MCSVYVKGIRCDSKRNRDIRVYDEKYYRKLGEKSIKRLISILENELGKV